MSNTQTTLSEAQGMIKQIREGFLPPGWREAVAEEVGYSEVVVSQVFNGRHESIDLIVECAIAMRKFLEGYDFKAKCKPQYQLIRKITKSSKTN